MCASMREQGDDIAYPSCFGFLMIHIGCLAVVWTGVTLNAVVLSLLLYVLRIFGIGAGYYRYFANRSFSVRAPVDRDR